MNGHSSIIDENSIDSEGKKNRTLFVFKKTTRTIDIQIKGRSRRRRRRRRRKVRSAKQNENKQ
jgi:hypothetical protein